MAKAMQKIELEISAISHTSSSNANYSIILGEKNGKRRLAIIIGSFEAQSIALAMEKMNTDRPLTHDLFRNVFDTMGIEMREVLINDLVDGIFRSLLVCEFNGMVENIDSRTSDAISLALRFNCPIFTYENIMEIASVEVDEAPNNATRKAIVEKVEKAFRTFTVSELSESLEEALKNEDYLRAAEIRDELNTRK